MVVYIIFTQSALGKIIDKKIAEKNKSDKDYHLTGNRLRKQFTVTVQETLQELAEETKSNRAILFEFSNGTTNLIGLPFLFMTAASEVASPGLPLISQHHQRLNTSVIASFLIKLEKEGYIFIDEKSISMDEFRILRQIMERADIKNALFYSIQGIDESIGFIVIVTTNRSGNNIDLHKSLTLLNKVSQKISSMINFNEIEKREKKNKKWK